MTRRLAKDRVRSLWRWVAGGGLLGALLLSKRSLRGRRLLHLGDSHVGGLEGPLEARVSASGGRYQAHFRVGISTPQAARAGWGGVVRAEGPDVVIVTLGTNDSPTESYRESVGALVDEIRAAAPAATVIWWGPPVLLRADVVELAGELVQLQRPEVTRRGGRYLDSRPYTSRPDEHAPDGIHLTRAGYDRWARSALRSTFWTA
ncbi:MAG: SGNH/GDSL hydrolase family protein [Vicinamibacteria bacterium]